MMRVSAVDITVAEMPTIIDVIFFSFFLFWSIFLMSFFFFYHPFYIECFMDLIVILTIFLHYITISLHYIQLHICTYCIGRLFLFYINSFVAVFYIFICISLFLQLYLSNFDILVSIKYSYLLFFHFIYNVFVSYVSCCIYIIFLLAFVFHVNFFT